MIKKLGRVLVREDKTVGLYFPYDKNVLKSGLYEVVEVLGERQLIYIGQPALENRKVQAFDPNGLLTYRDTVMLTVEELKSIKKHKRTERNKND
jgi:hypothetical protein